MDATLLKHCGVGVFGQIISVWRPTIRIGSVDGWAQFMPNTSVMSFEIKPKSNMATQIRQIARSKNRYNFAILFPDGDEFKFRGKFFSKRHNKNTTIPNRLEVVVTHIITNDVTFQTKQQSSGKMF